MGGSGWWNEEMTQEAGITAEIDGPQIVVRMLGTSFRATYFRSPDQQAILQSVLVADDSSATISRQEFETLGWEAALRKARELGWAV
jgi:hypothetical protein